jgi:hypothetical protein
MNSLRSISLRSAEQTFAVANTPLFLLRKLKADAAVSRIAREASPEKISLWLRAALKQRPKSVRAAVLPYVLLVSLYLQGNFQYLREASKLPSDHAYWFRYMAELLLNSNATATVTTFTMPPLQIRPATSVSSTNNITVD